MSDDSQLTVAELLARAQQENPGAESSRRRHRRSLDEGGVSVAELTGSLRKVEARPPESKHSSVPIDPVEEKAPEKMPDSAETAVISRVEAPVRERSSAATTTWSKFERPAPAVAAAPAEAAPAESLDATGEIPVVDAGTPSGVEVADTTKAVDTAEVSEVDQPRYDTAAVVEERASINPILLVLLVFVGLIAGILVFLAFQWVWANLPLAAAVILGLVFTALIVIGVRGLRTGKDALTMGLAGIAGLVATLGPGVVNNL